MRVLGLTTSTPRGGAAVSIDGRVAGSSGYVDLQSHAERIFEAIDRALAEAKLKRNEIDAIAVDVGPGSFTGVRVGIASAKGIALALGLPLLGVGSLEAMAEAGFADGVASPDELVFAAIDAKKDELFVAVYDHEGVAIVSPQLLARDPEVANCLENELNRKVRRVGEWPSVVSPALPDAIAIARVGARRLAARGQETAVEVEAVYVRAPDAKLPSP